MKGPLQTARRRTERASALFLVAFAVNGGIAQASASVHIDATAEAASREAEDAPAPDGEHAGEDPSTDETLPAEQDTPSEAGPEDRALPGTPSSAPALQLRTTRVDGVPEEGVFERSPERVDTLAGDDIRASGARTLEEALRRVSGSVAVTPTGTVTGLSVDGLPPSQLDVYIDGRPLGGTINSPEGPVVDLGTLPIDPERIERIDVHRGVGPAGSGGSSGVVVHIVTRPPEGTEGAIAVRQGITAGTDLAFRQARGTASFGLGERSVGTVRGSWLWRPPIDVDDDGRYDTTAQRTGSAGAEWTWRAPSGGLLRVGAEGWGQRSDVRRTPGPPVLGSPPEDRTRTWTVDAHATGRWTRDQGRVLEHTTQVGRMRHAFVKVASTGDEIPRAETTRDRVRQSASLQMPTGSWLVTPEVVAEVEQVGREGETGDVDDRVDGRVGVGVNAVWWPTDPLELEARGFADAHSAFGAGGLAGLGSAWTVAQPLVLRGGVSVARRLPSAEERYLFFDHSEVGYQLDGNPDLEPERLVTVRGGLLARTFEQRLALEAEGFVHWLDNAVEPILRETGTPALYSYDNIGRVRSGGLNASLRAQLPADLIARTSWTWLPLRESGESRSPRLLTSTHGWNAELRWRGQRSDRVGALLRADGRSPLTVAPGAPSPGGVWTLDAAVWAEILGPLTARLDGTNLLDRVDAAWGPKPGRVLSLELGARW